MDFSCGCLARMEPMLETCVLSEGLVLNHKQRHNALCSLLYSPSIGFRAPFVHKMTQDDVSDAWVCICAYFFIYSLIFFFVVRFSFYVETFYLCFSDALVNCLLIGSFAFYIPHLINVVVFCFLEETYFFSAQ